ncbi:hypothetical protein HYX09_02120 [Candidatus Woesearchaeota archaeon]|nr:hypothetical protein [Candidatus Woesearchaeota archaeon]
MRKSKFIMALLLFPILASLNAGKALAHCPLCTGAVGAAAIGAKYLGVDVSIIGVFIGAFAVSTGLWFARWVQGRFQKGIPFQASIIIFASFVLTVVPLMSIEPEPLYFPMLFTGAAGTALNRIYWPNKILFGSILGGMATMLAYWIHLKIKKARGRVLFPFQGIAITIVVLALTSFMLYFAL